MEPGTVAGQMPNLKTTLCDLSVSAPPADCSMDLERRVTELPTPLSVLGGALPLYPDAGLQGQRATMPAYHSSTLLANLGLQYCPSSGVHPLKHAAPPPLGPPPPLCLNTASGRLYRSMENLHWAAVPDPGLYAFSAPYGSVDSEFIFRCTATSRWYEGGPEGVPFCSPRASARRDLPLLPQWLFPGGGEGVLNGDARRGLREKLRLQSVRVTEPNKPLRPPAVPGPPAPCPPTEARPGCRITSPEEIKQEALRRLKLRRQNSSPDLTLHPSEEPRPTKSRTAEALVPPALRRPPAGRLHIPTFEEFKKMRQKEGGPQKQYPSTTGGQSEPCGDQTEGEIKRDQIRGDAGGGCSGVEAGGEQAGNTERKDSDCGRSFSTTESSEFEEDSRKEGLQDCQDRGTDASAVPICTSPMPRPPLQPLATPQEAEVGDTTSNTKEDVSGLTHPHPHLRENPRAPPTCCPALLLDGTDLSSYGAKISKMKDGFFGSALDLIKKSMYRFPSFHEVYANKRTTARERATLENP